MPTFYQLDGWPIQSWLYVEIFYLSVGIQQAMLLVEGTADGGTVVKVLCYKSEGRWFDSRWCHWNFSLT
jgi:hypothetical protein